MDGALQQALEFDEVMGFLASEELRPRGASRPGREGGSSLRQTLGFVSTKLRSARANLRSARARREECATAVSRDAVVATREQGISITYSDAL